MIKTLTTDDFVKVATNVGEEDPNTALTEASLLGFEPGFFPTALIIGGIFFPATKTLPDGGRIYSGAAGKVVVFND